MPLHLDDHLAAMRAIAEATRLRVVALLRHGELSVSDLTDILGQSQPRISRHLRLLADAGVVARHREGNFVFFSLTRSPSTRPLIDAVLAELDPTDSVTTRDVERLDVVRTRRAAAGQEYFERIAADWDEVRSLHAPDDMVEQAIVDALSPQGFDRLLDVGTGTGRMIQLLAHDAPPPSRIAGLDNSASMLAVARSNLERSGVDDVELRQGDVHQPPFDERSFDLIIVHQVLHFLDDPDRAVAAVARLLAPGGRLVIVDLAPHDLRLLQSDHAHKRLGFQANTVRRWISEAGLEPQENTDVVTYDDRLTVTIWLAAHPESASSTSNLALEAAR